MIRRLLAVILLAVPLHAQEPQKPEAPKPKTDHKIFFVGVSLLAASKTADAITTRQVLDRGGWENNPVFGPHPSPAKQAGINLGIFAAQSTVFYFTERSRHKWIRWAGRAFMAHTIEEHSRFTACSVASQSCRPFGF